METTIILVASQQRWLPRNVKEPVVKMACHNAKAGLHQCQMAVDQNNPGILWYPLYNGESNGKENGK